MTFQSNQGREMFEKTRERAKSLCSEGRRSRAVLRADRMVAMMSRHWSKFQTMHGGISQEEDKLALAIAIMFALCVYEPGNSESREAAADEADAELRFLKADRAFRKKVCSLILSASDEVEPGDDLQRLFRDLRRSYLITHEEILEVEEEAIDDLRDAGFLLREIFRSRLQFYKDLVDSEEPIFVSIFKNYESIARDNLSRRITSYEHSV